MDCPDVRPCLPLHPDPEEPPETREAVQAHLRACRACASEWKRLQAAWDALGAWDGIEPSADFAARVRGRARGAAPPKRAARWIPRSAAAAALLAVGLWSVRSPAPPPPTGLTPTEIDVIRNLDLLENYDTAEAFDQICSGALLDDVGSLVDLLAPAAESKPKGRKAKEF